LAVFLSHFFIDPAPDEGPGAVPFKIFQVSQKNRLKYRPKFIKYYLDNRIKAEGACG